jgi:two-component system, chemotaxis family, response regulator Rcp1
MASDEHRLFLVEDNRGDAILFKRAFERQGGGVHITVAGSAETALDLLRTAKDAPETLPSLMIVDINLPGINGLDFIKRCKADDELRRVPAIVLSSSNTPGEVLTAYNNCAAGYIRKPTQSSQYDHIAECLTSCWLSLMELPEGSAAVPETGRV